MNTKGFTLIELMIVVSIIGILTAIALPAYQSYTVRSQIAEAMTLVNEIKPEITGYYKAKGGFPRSNKSAGIPAAKYLIGNYVERMEVVNGAIQVTLGNKINKLVTGKIISFRPLVVIDSPLSPISWACGYAAPPKGMKAIGKNRTNVDTGVLVWACRE